MRFVNKKTSSETSLTSYCCPTTGEKETEEEYKARRQKEIAQEADQIRDSIEKYITELYEFHDATVNKGFAAMELAKTFVEHLPSEEVKRLGMALTGLADVTLIYCSSHNRYNQCDQ